MFAKTKKSNAMKKEITLVLTIAFATATIGCSEGNKSTKAITCTVSSEGYSSGYEAGHGQAVLVSAGFADGTSDCDTYLRSTNNGHGPIGEIPECWCEGFKAGFAAK
jgi:hypothetical protein